MFIDDAYITLSSQEGDNRSANVADVSKGGLVLASDEGFRFKSNWRGAGVAVPVFALRSESGFGVGEFPDIKVPVNFIRPRIGLPTTLCDRIVIVRYTPPCAH